MSSSGSSQSVSRRSKKQLMESPCPKSQLKNPNSPSMVLPTPEKPPENIHSRARNQGVALSVNEIRQAARSRRPSGGPTISARSKLDFDSSSSPCKLQNTAKSTEMEELPEKYEVLGKFFDALDSVIRLLKLKGSMATFSKISPRVESLTDRRFSYCHLAQLKHILPAAIEIKRVLMFDERTSCMKPDLHVTLNVKAFEFDEKSKLESKNISLRKLFRARLADFVKAHSQDDEVPEEQLPEPFNRKKQNKKSDDELVSLSLPDENPASSEEQKRAVASHLPRSSGRNYIISLNEKTISACSLSRERLSSGLSSLSSNEKPQASNSTLKPESSDPTAAPLEVGSPIKEMASTPAKPMSSPLTAASTPAKAASTPVASTPDKVDSTPVKFASTPPEFALTSARLTAYSTEAQAQKRRGHTRLDDLVDPPNKLVRRRLLKCDTFVEDEKADDDLSILPKTLLQSIIKQEKKVTEDQDPAISQAKRRRKMIAYLPRLFNTIYFLFQSIRRSVITKEELVHKIISGHSSIVDRSEVEEQLNLMLELVPDWISEKRSFSGDVLISVNKMSSPESVRSRLEEENRQVTAPVS